MYMNCGVFVANKIIDKYFGVIMPLCGEEISNRCDNKPYKSVSPFSIPSMQAHDELLEDGYTLDEARLWAPHIASIATWALDPYVVMFDPDLAGLLSWHRHDLHMDSNVLRTPVEHEDQTVRCYYISHTFKTNKTVYSGAFVRVDHNPRTGKWCQVFTFLSSKSELLSISFPLVNRRSIQDCLYAEATPRNKKEIQISGLEDMIMLALQMRLYSIYEPLQDATTTPPQLYGRSQMVNVEPFNVLPPGSTVRYAYIGREAGDVLRSSRKGNACIPYKGDPNMGNWIPRPIPGIEGETEDGALYPEWMYLDKC